MVQEIDTVQPRIIKRMTSALESQSGIRHLDVGSAAY